MKGVVKTLCFWCGIFIVFGAVALILSTIAEAHTYSMYMFYLTGTNVPTPAYVTTHYVVGAFMFVIGIGLAVYGGIGRKSDKAKS